MSVETESGGGLETCCESGSLVNVSCTECRGGEGRGGGSGEPSGGAGVRNDFNAARSRPPEAGAANRHVSGPGPSAAEASGGGGGTCRSCYVFNLDSPPEETPG